MSINTTWRAIAAAALLVTGIESAHAQTVETSRLHDLALPAAREGAFALDVPLGNETRRVVLSPHNIRTSDFAIFVNGYFVPGLTDESPPHTYRGYVEGAPNSRVAASLSRSGLTAMILDRENGEAVCIEPEPQFEAGSRARYRITTLSDTDLSANAFSEPISLQPNSNVGSSGFHALQQVLALDLACDADYEMYLANGSSVINTVDFIETVINMTSLLYEEQFGLIYQIPAILVRTAEPDPYPAVADCGDLANLAKAEWNANQTGIARDHVHLFSGKTVAFGGYGLMGPMCTQSNSYSVTRPYAYSNFVRRAVVVAHETGHTWGACHCDVHAFCTPEGTPCSGIMHSGAVGLFFDAATITTISAAISGSTCLVTTNGSAAPVLTSITPAQVDVLGSETLTLSGDNFHLATEVVRNGTVLSLEQFTLIDAQTIQITAPRGTALGPVGVRVTGPGGDSAQQRFGYVQTDPPRMIQNTAQVFAGDSVVWDYGSLIGRRADLLISNSSTTTTINGWPVLASATVETSGLLDSIGLGQCTKVFSTSDVNSTFHVQAVLYDPTTNQVVGSTNISSFLVETF